jgi:para-aminobenzoate synthetase
MADEGFAGASERGSASEHDIAVVAANLTYRVERTSDLAPAAAYLRLRELNPAPYAGFLQHDVRGHEAWLLSSSPERYALVTGDRTLETKPIKGTTPRGADADEDALLRFRLASEPKFRAENLMIVDLLRNDLARVCAPGSVAVPALMEVESYATVLSWSPRSPGASSTAWAPSAHCAPSSRPAR